MLTVLESIKLSSDYLEKKGIESPRINAELLLAKILNCKRLDLYLSFDRPLQNNEIEAYREFIRRRGLYEPLQYIVGSVEFYGIEFIVNPSVLIPRQETEILVETIILNSDKEKKIKILDVGTGSGNITIALAKNLPMAEIISIDCSSEALQVAGQNAEINNVANQITFLTKDIVSDFDFGNVKFDVIVSNPPYVSKNQFPELRPELRNHEPVEALTDGGDGFSFFRIISSQGKKLLKENGRLFFEIGEGQSELVKKIMEAENYSNVKIVKDYLQIDRVISGEII